MAKKAELEKELKKAKRELKSKEKEIEGLRSTKTEEKSTALVSVGDLFGGGVDVLANVPAKVSVGMVLDDVFDVASGKITEENVARLGITFAGAVGWYQKWKRENETPIHAKTRLQEEIASLEAVRELKPLENKKADLIKELQRENLLR